MTATAEGLVVSRAKLPIGRVISETFSCFGKAPIKFIGLHLLFVVPSALFTYFFLSHTEITTKFTTPLIVFTPISYFLQLLVSGATTYGAFEIEKTGDFAFERSVAVGFRRIFFMIITAILAYVILVIGLVLLVVPGIIVGLAITPILTVCVVESLGPIRSLKRSFALTRKNRLRIFGALLAFYIPLFAIIFGIRYVAIMLAGFLVGTLVTSLFGLVTGALGSIFVTILYVELRGLHDGADVSRVATTFD